MAFMFVALRSAMLPKHSSGMKSNKPLWLRSLMPNLVRYWTGLLKLRISTHKNIAKFGAQCSADVHF